MKTRLLTPAELAATFRRPDRPMLVRPGPKPTRVWPLAALLTALALVVWHVGMTAHRAAVSQAPYMMEIDR